MKVTKLKCARHEGRWGWGRGWGWGGVEAGGGTAVYVEPRTPKTQQ